MNSIAVLRLSALGDVAMTIPLINALKHSYPKAKIYWIIAKPFDQLVSGLEEVTLITLNKPKTLADYMHYYRRMRAYNFDVLLVPQASFRSNLLCGLTRAKRKVGYDKLHARDGQRWFVKETVPAVREHLIDSFMRFANHLNNNTSIFDWQIPIAEHDWQWAKDTLSNCHGIKLAVSLMASKTERNWPIERYIELLNTLQQRWHVTPIIIGGPGADELKFAETVCNGLTGDYLNLAGKSSFKQLAATLGMVDAMVAPDTGPLHIAQAMGTPVVGLYAVAPPEKTGPYHSMQWVVNRFPEAVKKILNKDPNNVGWRQRVHDQRAMELISVVDVAELLEKLFVMKLLLKYKRKIEDIDNKILNEVEIK